MASSKQGVTATLGTFAIDLQLKIDYKNACIANRISMTDELTEHIQKYVAKHKQSVEREKARLDMLKKMEEERVQREAAAKAEACGAPSSQG